MTLYVGFDIGGTKARAAFRMPGDHSGRITTIESEGGNLQVAGAEQVAERISGMLREIRERLEQSNPGTVVVAGIAGAGREQDRRAVEEAFSRLGGHSDRLCVVSDASVALEGAFSGGSGVIIISGTGSGAYARDEAGHFKRTGGWGPRLGDPASGVSVGWKALRAVAHAFDGGTPTILSALVSDTLGIQGGSSLIDAVYREDLDPASVAHLALQAASDGDPVARGLIETELDVLARESALVMTDDVESRFVLQGGLCQNPYFKNALESRLLELKPDWRRVEPDGGPEVGALRMAETLP